LKINNLFTFNFTPSENTQFLSRHSLTAFTLIELLTVVIIMSILVSLGVPVYNRTIERSRDKEAQSGLLLIQGAQMIYFAENGEFYPLGGGNDGNIATINSNLHLNLKEDAVNGWDYALTSSTSGGGQFTATAQRNGGGFNRTYTINQSSTAPVCGGACP
jgi:prepilin-type N-terminal cleavage/methylation domain-containing protein